MTIYNITKYFKPTEIKAIRTYLNIGNNKLTIFYTDSQWWASVCVNARTYHAEVSETKRKIANKYLYKRIANTPVKVLESYPKAYKRR